VAQYQPSAKGYADYQEMLGQRDIDAVIIATPPHWHALQAIHAVGAGKDIYLQKPMSLHVAESLAVKEAVEKHGAISQIGTQIHAGENYRRVVEWIRSGRLGKVSVVRNFFAINQGPEGIGHAPDTDPPEGFDWNQWVGPYPMRPFNWLLIQNGSNRCSFSQFGDWTPGMAPHILDLPCWALELDYPLTTSSSGGRFTVRGDGDGPDTHEVLWQYPNMTMTWMMSIVNSYGFDLQDSPGIKRRLGVYFHGANGTLFSNYSKHKIVPEGDRLEDTTPPTPSIPSSPGHEREWVECIKSRQQPSCNVAYHSKIDVAIGLATLSLRLGRSIHFDPGAERIVDDEEAARVAKPEYRDPWRFPEEYL
jgi:predicted dehydrogenase